MANPIDTSQYYALSSLEKERRQGVREAINHPNISGPFETQWGYTDFSGAGLPVKIGLPCLPGQITTLR